MVAKRKGVERAEKLALRRAARAEAREARWAAEAEADAARIARKKAREERKVRLASAKIARAETRPVAKGRIERNARIRGAAIGSKVVSRIQRLAGVSRQWFWWLLREGQPEKAAQKLAVILAIPPELLAQPDAREVVMYPAPGDEYFAALEAEKAECGKGFPTYGAIVARMSAGEQGRE